MLKRRDFGRGLAAGPAVAATLGSFALIKVLKRSKELTINSSDLADVDLVTLPCVRGKRNSRAPEIVIGREGNSRLRTH
jgi:hypothetical protein